jgi:pimeloyl-ACP methyl ester carboxylesterase
VLIVPPFGWDELSSYRSRRELARRLAGAGHPALRIDLPGTGDSTGVPDLDAWSAAIAGAAAWLRRDAERVVAVGIGLGALLAAAAPVDGPIFDGVVLWGAPQSGRAAVRELRAIAAVEAASNVAADLPEARLNDGDVLAPGGFRVPPALAEQIRALEASDVEGALRVDRDDAYAAMMSDPADAVVPHETIARIVDWVGAFDAPGRPAAAAPRESAEAELVVDGVRIRERPLGTGILAEPVDGPRAPLAAAILNGGAVRRVGHNRMSVDTARRWAARGVPTVRLDFPGIGEADGGADDYADFAALYVPAFVAQARAAVDALGAERAVLVGLCSGAYWSFHAALEDERVSAAFMLNPRALYWEDTLEAARQARRIRRELLSLRGLRKLATRGKPLLRLQQLGRLVAGTIAGARAGRDVSRVEAAFDRLRDSGKRGLLAFSDSEPLHEELARDGTLGRASRWPNLEIAALPGADHTLRGVHMQEAAYAVLDAALERELELAAAVDRDR